MTIPETQVEPEALPAASGRPLDDKLLLDLPLAGTTTGTTEAKLDEGEAAYQRLRELQAGRTLRGREEPPQRSLPWPIDIFLYPLSRAGMMITLLCAGVAWAVSSSPWRCWPW